MGAWRHRPSAQAPRACRSASAVTLALARLYNLVRILEVHEVVARRPRRFRPHSMTPVRSFKPMNISDDQNHVDAGKPNIDVFDEVQQEISNDIVARVIRDAHGLKACMTGSCQCPPIPIVRALRIWRR
uniref:Uncharacterized protein n=1 Tax=Oryza sativa subsp. japonica TaxID=39947 RepID=Q6EPY0_ORYSJ|nr:hypothetical protein [Oryza sativa Japonica Group]BAD29290.1 hypothetical protein [Oryza sativa Japonica Group]